MSKRRANLVLAVYFAVQAILLLQSALPIGGQRQPWPWRMFGAPSPWLERLDAVGILPDETRVPIPIGELYRYRVGFSPLGLLEYRRGVLDESASPVYRERFARVLGKKMAERGVALERVELARRFRHIETGKRWRRTIGEYPAGEYPAPDSPAAEGAVHTRSAGARAGERP